MKWISYDIHDMYHNFYMHENISGIYTNFFLQNYLDQKNEKIKNIFTEFC